MTDTLHRAPNQEYYDRVAALSAVPFWQLGEMHEPSGPERPHVWHWDEVVPELLRSQHLEGEATGELQRRALLLRNPGLTPPAFGATPTLVAAYQMLLPGESAPVHAHSFSALRFGASGGDARMVVDGHRVPMHPGDLVLTPAWCWHGHVHTGGDEPVVWFDGLDVPLLVALRAGFYRDPSSRFDQSEVRDSAGTEATGLGLVPAGHQADRHSPVRRYPWDEAYPALQRLLAMSDGDAVLEYRNPVTGGPALATIACALHGVAAGGRTARRRETASSVRFVARGSGMLVIDDRPYDVGPNDVIAVPAWRWHEIRAGGEELILFEISDRPVHDAFGLSRAEVSNRSTPDFRSPTTPTKEDIR
jgi:gentisate 1,2-dioxygenase